MTTAIRSGGRLSFGKPVLDERTAMVDLQPFPSFSRSEAPVRTAVRSIRCLA
jgi:hypothetical protein